MLEREALSALIDLSAALATRDRGAVEDAIGEACGAAPHPAVEECVLQAHLFIGFPDVIEALIALRRSAVRAPSGSESNSRRWPERGRELCRTVYGGNYEKLRRNVAALHPDLDRWMVETGYGRVLSRPGLEPIERELCIVALLVVWGAKRQLHSHLRGALHVGAPVSAVEEAVGRGCARIDAARAEEARTLWSVVRGGWNERTGADVS